ncbi:MAG: glycine-rich domain-containing protein, partial [Planctomycetia bacterium]
MIPEQAALWSEIQRFPLDDPASSFDLTTRLARDNDWRGVYARRVVVEYRKFLFLAAVADGPVCPSDAVDQAWHLHLVYTRSYWDDLCGRVLKFPLHHGPTKGGAAEKNKYREWYQATLAAYERSFGPPPRDIWPAADERFRDLGRFARVDRRRYWMLKRPTLSATAFRRGAALATGLAAATVVGCLPAAAAFPWPLDLQGPEFLTVFFASAAAAVL